jgi:hypothetical protein
MTRNDVVILGGTLAGDAGVVLAGGTESMSGQPHIAMIVEACNG